MNISDFYSKDASEQWFSTKYDEKTVHESLVERGFVIISRETLQREHSILNMPIVELQFSWGDHLPAPLPNFKNAFLAKELFDIKEIEYQSEILSELISKWMLLLPSKKNTWLALIQITI